MRILTQYRALLERKWRRIQTSASETKRRATAYHSPLIRACSALADEA